MAENAALEAQIAQWRGFVQRRQAIAVSDVDEMEDHLRQQVADLGATGLDDDEAFLVAVKRMGNLDDVSQEFAREHSDRLWKQLVLLPDEPDAATPRWRELVVVVALALGAGLGVKIGSELVGAPVLMRNIGLLVLPFLGIYLAWKRRITARVVAALVVGLVAVAVLVNVYPLAPEGSMAVLVGIHAPVLLWALVGVAYTGGRWRSDARRMDFVRFTGELVVYFALLALGGGVLIGLTAGVLQVVDIDFEPAMESWILPFCVPGAVVVAAWLVEAKQNVVENIAPVLTRVFTPLTIVMLVVLLVVLLTSGSVLDADRELLILMDLVLVLVLCLLLYSLSARDRTAPAGLFDGVQLVLLLAALAVDLVALSAMAARIAEFGFSPNKVAALGLNLLLLVHLVWSARLSFGFLRGREGFDALERWQTRYLPAYAVWAAVVVVVFPPVLGFA